jgi:hypothetical protein
MAGSEYGRGIIKGVWSESSSWAWSSIEFIECDLVMMANVFDDLNMKIGISFGITGTFKNSTPLQML